MSEAYKKAGVDLSSGDEAKKKIAALAKKTFSSAVASGIGSFGGVYRFPKDGDTLLLASSDGVGTKIRIAVSAGIYDTVGQDLVNHCVNDILTLGAEPLFFLDYIGHSDLSPDIIAKIVEGLSNACIENSLSLIGGETAQMPGTYRSGDFDLVGFIVGTTGKKSLIDGSKILPGDAIIAIASNGLQTNGYSLARKILLDSGKYKLDDKPEILNGESVCEALLAVHPSYKKAIFSLINNGIGIQGMAHITGSGIPGNLVRILPENCRAEVDVSKISILPIFSLIRKEGNISENEMFDVFNMGAGFMVVLAKENVGKAISAINSTGKNAFVCGGIIARSRGVELLGLKK